MTTEWRRYYVEDDEVKVEHIDSRTVYYENPDERMWLWNDSIHPSAWRETGNDTFRYFEPVWPSGLNDRRFVMLRAGINDLKHVVVQPSRRYGRSPEVQRLREMITPTQPLQTEPHLWGAPWAPIRKSPVAEAVKIALDGSVN